MTEADATAELELDTDAASEPALDGDDISQILASYVVTAPSSTGASDGNWSLNRAKAAGWRRKAGREASRTDFLADGRNTAANARYGHFTEMAAQYDRLADGAGEPQRPGVAAYVGGVSRSDKAAQAGDVDRVRPAFTRDLHRCGG
jgi:hypothetical protein